MKSTTYPIAALLVSILLMVQTAQVLAQCTGVFPSGPTSPCVNSTSSYFASGGNAASGSCYVSWVSGGYQSYNNTSVTWGSTPGNYTVQITCSCGSINYPVTVQATPVAGTIASGNQSICYGDSPASITSSGAVGQLTWQGAPVGSSTWTDLTTGSATLASGFISNTVSKQYRLVSYNCGTTLYSNTVTVTVNQVSTPPAPNNTNYACGNQTLSFNGSPPGGTTWYWQGTTSTGTSQSNSSSSYPVSSSGTYYLRAYSSGCWSGSSSVTVTVNPLPQDPGLSAQFNVNQQCGNTSVSVTGSPQSGETWYWESSPTGTSIGTQAATSSPYNSNTPGTVYIRAVKNNCWSANAAPANYDVKVIPDIAVPATQTICSGSSVTLAVTNPNAIPGVSFTWSVLQGSNVTGANTPSNGSTSTTQTLTNTGSTQSSNTYTIKPSANGCTGLPGTVVVNVNPVPAVIVSPTYSVCTASTTAINYTNSNNVAGTTYTWSVNASNVYGASGQLTGVTTTSIAQSLYSQSGDSEGTVTYTINASASMSGVACSSGTTTVVTVKPAPVITLGANQSDQLICSGTPASVNVSMLNNISGTVYNWSSVAGPNVTGLTTPMTGDASATQVLTNTGNTPTIASYTVTPVAGSCAGQSVTANITINPSPQIEVTNNRPVICSGRTPTDIIFSNPNSVAGTSFSWTADATNVAGAAAASGTSISQTLTCTGVTSGSVTYTVSASATFSGRFCVSSKSTVVNVTPLPVLSLSPQTMFVGHSSSITLSGTQEPATYSYALTASTNVSGAADGTDNPIQQTWTLTDGVNPGTLTFSVISSAAGCSSDPASLSVGLYPQPLITASAAILYMGSHATLSGQSFFDTYYWSNSAGPLSGGNTITVSKPDNYNLSVMKNGVLSDVLAVYKINDQFSTQNLNFVVTNSPVVAISDANQISYLTVDQLHQEITYFDGLARPNQSVITQGAPSRKDIVQPMAYDQVGRESKKYLPFTNGTNGWYKSDPVGVFSGSYTTSPQYLFYNANTTSVIASDSLPYSFTQFEASNLNRPAQDFGPGKTWTLANKYIGHQYLANQTSEVILFTYDATTGLVSTGSGAAAYYSLGQLNVKVTTDEQGNEVREFSDKLGHLVCKKVQYQTDAQGVKQYTSTYYLYDDLGNLAVVLPPEAVKKIISQLN